MLLPVSGIVCLVLVPCSPPFAWCRNFRHDITGALGFRFVAELGTGLTYR
jgi:hypothetical protein